MTEKKNLTLSGLDPKCFEAVVDGKPVSLYTLTNDCGTEVTVTNYGGRIPSLLVKDKDGALRDVVLGYDNIDDYLRSPGNYGALIGRYGNRIGNAEFSLDGVTYKLPVNNNQHCLHGGLKGYDKKVWDVVRATSDSIELHLVSPDGEEGFPGTLDVTVRYTLTPDNELRIDYEATTDKATVVNLTNHSYFNLNGDLGAEVEEGHVASSIHNHVARILADTITPSDSTLITDGSFMNLDGSPLDFRNEKPIGQDINADDEQLHNGNGYDHNYVLNAGGDLSKLAMRVFSPTSGIVMEVFTTEPALQMYTGNFLDGSEKAKHGVSYPERSAVAFETQHHPNTPNCPQYPSCTLRPGEKYATTTIYKFGVL